MSVHLERVFPVSIVHNIGALARAGAVPLTFTDRDAYVSHSSRSILFTTGQADLPQPFNLATTDRPYRDRTTDDVVAKTSLKLMTYNSL